MRTQFSHIGHICCCGMILYRTIAPGTTWTCSQCGAKWKQTQTLMRMHTGAGTDEEVLHDDMVLQEFGQVSCWDCYYHDFKNGGAEQKQSRGINAPLIIATEEEQKNYVTTHCRHARHLLGLFGLLGVAHAEQNTTLHPTTESKVNYNTLCFTFVKRVSAEVLKFKCNIFALNCNTFQLFRGLAYGK